MDPPSNDSGMKLEIEAVLFVESFELRRKVVVFDTRKAATGKSIKEDLEQLSPDILKEALKEGDLDIRCQLSLVEVAESEPRVQEESKENPDQ